MLKCRGVLLQIVINPKNTHIMMTRNFLILLVIAGILGFVSCEDDDGDDPEPYMITQEELNDATISVGFAVGNENQSDAVVAHNGDDEFSPDSTYREIFANVDDLSGELEVGTIISKKTFAATSAGEKDPDRLYRTFAMVKREAGFDSENANWEYIDMPNNAGNDFSAQPNGDLDASSVRRGTLSNCIACHTEAGGGDFLFVND